MGGCMDSVVSVRPTMVSFRLTILTFCSADYFVSSRSQPALTVLVCIESVVVPCVFSLNRSLYVSRVLEISCM
jgi:hypothetical protein